MVVPRVKDSNARVKSSTVLDARCKLILALVVVTEAGEDDRDAAGKVPRDENTSVWSSSSSIEVSHFRRCSQECG